MIKTVFTLLPILAFLFSGVSYAQEQGYDIDFKIKGLKDSTRIQLAYYYGDKKLLQDSAFVKNDKFTFSGKKQLARGLYIVVIKDLGYFDLIINEDQKFEIQTSSDGLMENIKAIGHEENSDFFSYLKEIQPFNEQISKFSAEWTKDSCQSKTDESCNNLREKVLDLKKQANSIKQNYVSSHPSYFSSKMFKVMDEISVPLFEHITDNNLRKSARFNYYKDHFFDNVDFNENGLIRTPLFEKKIDKYFDELTYQKCDSARASVDIVMGAITDYNMFRYMINHITKKYEKSKIMCIDCIKLHMYKNYYLEDERVDWLDSTNRAKIERETWKLQHNQCGAKAYPLTKKDTNGVSHNLLTVDADYTIVYFWSATCGHCKKTTPKLQEFYNRVHEQYNTEVYAVHIDKKRKEFDKFTQKHQFEWINTIDDGLENDYRTAYNVFSTPTIYLLNEKKEIIAKNVDIATMEKIITGKESPTENESKEARKH